MPESSPKVAESLEQVREGANAARLASVGRLAAGVAHEINNPLAVVASNLLWLEEQLPGASEEVRQTLSDSRQCCQRMKEIVATLQQFSREGRGTVAQSYPIRTAVEFATRMVSRETGDRIKVEVLVGELTVRADPAKLGQVLVSLLTNAVQAMAGAQAAAHRIRISAHRVGERIRLEVSDNGPGIPAEHLPHLFDPFFTTRDPGAGMGLGLWVSQGLMASMGGTLAVESEPGQGATFRLELPAGEAQEAGITLSAPGASPSRVGTVLVVDDEPLACSAVRRILTPHQAVHTAGSVETAVAALEKEKYDLVLCDLMMPGQTGIDLHRLVGERFPAMLERLVVVTGGAFTAAGEKFLRESAVPVVSKPFDPQALRALVAERVRAASPG